MSLLVFPVSMITALSIFFSYGEFTITLMFRIFFFVYTLAILVFGIFLALFSNLKETKDNFWIFYSFFYWFLQNFIAIYALAQIILRRKKIWYKTEKEGIITDFNITENKF